MGENRVESNRKAYYGFFALQRLATVKRIMISLFIKMGNTLFKEDHILEDSKEESYST